MNKTYKNIIISVISFVFGLLLLNSHKVIEPLESINSGSKIIIGVLVSWAGYILIAAPIILWVFIKPITAIRKAIFKQ